MKSLIKTIIIRWLFLKEYEEIQNTIKYCDSLPDSDKFFIDQGKRFVQFQLNNKNKKTVPYSLMGHGFVTASKYLEINSKKEERLLTHQFRRDIQRMADKLDIVVAWGNRKELVTVLPRRLRDTSFIEK